MTAAAHTPDLALGIDTGGTYTDAVLVTYPAAAVVGDRVAIAQRWRPGGAGDAPASASPEGAVVVGDCVAIAQRWRPGGAGDAPASAFPKGAAVVASAKALTTPHDLSVGVAGAIHRVLQGAGAPVDAARIGVVGLSSTLATNAIVEGVGHPVCLILIGYDPQLLRRFDLVRHLVTDDVVFVAGGHDGAGRQIAPLDEATVIDAVAARRDRVDAFAVSGYFAVRNPAHEQRAGQLVRAGAPGVPVTCGGQLTGELDSVRRATTAALNASLVPLLRGLVTTVRATLRQAGIAAPLMVVKGDGSMVGADFALERPVETILSGPAASVIGAWHLAGRRDAWVVDVGGTTTDIAVLRGGLPRLDPEGARVGGWRTLVETIHVHTVGLGGDSHVQVDERRRPAEALRIGPRRAVPLALLSRQHDGVCAELRRQRSAGAEVFPGEFALALGHGAGRDGRGEDLLRRLGDGPQSLSAIAEASPYGRLALSGLTDLERRRAVVRAGFTPTDALHVLGRYNEYDTDAAALGAELLAPRLGLSPQAFCERVVAEVSRRVALEVAGKALADEGEEAGWEREPGAGALLDRAFGEHPRSDLACRLTLQRPLVMVGAPVAAYGPGAADALHTELVIPPHADVANAVGAVAGGVVQHLRVRVRPTERDGIFHVLLPDGLVAVRSAEEGVALAHRRVPGYLTALLHRAGADGVEVRVARDDHTAPVAGQPGVTLVETELVFTAVGKPRLDGGA